VKALPLFLTLLVVTAKLAAQGVVRQTYHDTDKKKLKEVYYVKDTIRNILHGKYSSYHINGNIESSGQFVNNETAGVWEFYFETGSLKMRGILFKGANYGFWEYFFESGKKNMEGIIYGKNKEGEWKTFYENGQVKEIGEYKDNKRNGPWRSYFEDGLLKSDIEYDDDYGRCIEYAHSGKVLGEGPKMGARQVGHWRYFSEEGFIQSEGDFADGKRSGEWIEYFSSGKISSKGNYQNGEPSGKWDYFFSSGAVSTSGEFLGGQKNGYWKTFTDNGILISEVDYRLGSGEYREFHKSGKLKVKGNIVNGKKQGLWEFYFEGGQLEGKCEFVNGKGTYYGYYPGGALQTKGTIDNGRKTGTWDIYDEDGELSGYYKPYYEQAKIGSDIIAFENNTVVPKKQVKHFTYFRPRANEFRGMIIGGNPVLMFAGMFPMAIEFYSQERLGHEFEFVGIRNPFFMDDESIPEGELYERGYMIAIKQKFYNPIRLGMWYLGHELRFTNFGHFSNISQQGEIITISAFEQRVEYGWMLGYRFMQRNNTKGITIDAFASVDAGYRSMDVDDQYKDLFKDVNQSKFVTSFHAGLNIGHIFSNR